jgi:DNA-binding response OmpR family regulator
MRFLIVDDQQSIAALVARLITKAGHESCLAADGFTAINLAAELPPEVVLLDIQMPGIDGYQTAKRLRDRHGKQFPIFAVTAAPVDLLLAEQSGFDGVFTKPFSVEKLNTIISQVV